MSARAVVDHEGVSRDLHLMPVAKRDIVFEESVAVTTLQRAFYFTTVTIGTPRQAELTLQIDTGAPRLPEWAGLLPGWVPSIAIFSFSLFVWTIDPFPVCLFLSLSSLSLLSPLATILSFLQPSSHPLLPTPTHPLTETMCVGSSLTIVHSADPPAGWGLIPIMASAGALILCSCCCVAYIYLINPSATGGASGADRNLV